MSKEAIPVAGAGAFARLARRTAALRLGAAAALLLLGLVAILLGRHPRVHELHFLPAGSNGVVVLDLSASISSDTYSQIGSTLGDLVSTRGRYGLVVFSDTAYEALPPGSPAESLRPLIRFFTLPPQRTPGVAPTFPDNPWTRSFSAGTRISTGLELARSIMIGAHLAHPAVLLLSDLDDDAGDLPALSSVAGAYKRERIRLNVVGLNAAADDQARFREFIRGNGMLTQGRLPQEPSPKAGGARFPVWLAAVALALSLLLALNELVLARLTWAPDAKAAA
jgi:hypothetical protein